MGKRIGFPKDFLWGAAVAAYQVEGGIENSDWSTPHQKNGGGPAGKACDHYNRYEQDFDLIEELNLNAFRFSIEWSRIEPEPGKFNEQEIEHYKKYLGSLKSRGIATMVTLHHFTSPAWFAKTGGWSNKKSVFYFARFTQKMLKELGDLVDFWLTINEPLIYTTVSYLQGRWPPKKRNPILVLKVIKNQITAHKKVYKDFHKIKSNIKVGIAKNNQFFEPFSSKNILDKLAVQCCNYFWNEFFLNRIKRHLDFIGLNYYFHNKIKFPFSIRNKNKIVSDLGWEIYPQGIYHVLKDLKKYNLPVYITENGVADKNDKLRRNFIRRHLSWIWRAIHEDINVKGYFHWSLIDNFEWDKGIEPRFGLIEIDYSTQERKIRQSALYYTKVCKERALIM